MKRFLAFILCVFTTIFAFSQSYKIEDYKFNIKGCRGIDFGKTSETALLMKCPIDTNTIFPSKEEIDKYIANYKQQLINLRAFDKIELSHQVVFDENLNLYKIHIDFNIEDSNHLLIVPYPKYDSNSGLNIKIKGKDSNFLGTLNPLSADFYFNYNDSNKTSNYGMNFDYTFPFRAGPFYSSWINNFNIDYIHKSPHPTMFTKTGLNFHLPKPMVAFNFGAYQIVGYSKHTYFSNIFSFSTPFTLYRAPNFSVVSYTPYVDFIIDYSAPKGLNGRFDDFRINFGQTLTNGMINWNDKFRKGYNLVLRNDFIFDMDLDFVVPSISFEGSMFLNYKMLNRRFLNRIGIYSRLYAFSTIPVPGRFDKVDNVLYGIQNFAPRLRGILDKNFPATPCGIVLNIDIPIQILTTNFGHDIFNFTMHFVPFMDIALSSNNVDLFNLKQKNLTAGMEVLVYPKRFSSYTIRASVGVDVKAFLKSSSKIRGLWDNKEIYIGLDLHY